MKLFFKLIFLVLLSSLIYPNMVKMVHVFKSGTAVQTTPMPLYGFLRPSVNKLLCNDFTYGIDFGLIYYNSKQFDKGDIYNGSQYDVFERPLTYPPLICWLYHHSLCHMGFPQAILWHLGIQITLLLSASFFILKYYRLSFMFLPVAVSYFVMLFLTPVGLAWVERGQADIYSALAILFLMFAVYESKTYAFILAAFFISIKPTIAPLFVQTLIIYLLINFNYKKLFDFSLFTLIVLMAMFCFPQYSIHYWILVYKARLWLLEGITLVGRMPDTVVFLIPIVSLLAYLIPLYFVRGKDIFLKTFLPYATGLAAVNILLTYSSWEYRTISFLGFIPMVIAWAKAYASDKLYKREFLNLFILFLFVALHGFWVIREVAPKQEYFIASYLAYYLAVAAISLLRIVKQA